MISYIIRRLFILPVILFGVSLLIFSMIMMLGPYQRLSTYITDPAQLKGVDDVEQLIAKYGLDDPWYEQYGRWISGVAQGDFGWSESAGAPVTTAIANRFPATIELALLSLIPVIFGGIILGVISAVHHNKLIDHIIRIFAVIGWSFPSFVFGLLVLMIFYGVLGWLPPGRLSNWATEIVRSAEFANYTGMYILDGLLNFNFAVVLDAIRHMIAPVITISILWWAFILRITRSNMLETLKKDYIRTARAKGLADNIVVYKHAVRNALIPVVTVAGQMILGLAGGLVIVESIFNIRGLGQFMATSAQQLDYPGVLGGALYFGLLLILINLFVDVSYAVIDPRIRLE
ncbi:peptide/nickel transport system permease protein [Halanaerobium saccharolyticum]|uniref:Peptide/nickel transport system permease protein n=1 Tax=Halanaerobium saccharolyticum TaxID=43595 RepID=A0A4R6LVJ6_9FIRM|nr:ABC transporter permease [Halanaerobium saccharolyticum]TDO92105.1 peptide/nickel transport system permease protein [Halanaerobium saccharolyticum]